MNFLAIAFPKDEAESFQSFMSQEHPGIKLTVFPHSLKKDWVNVNLAIESTFDIYAIGYDYHAHLTSEVFSQLDLGEKKEALN